MTEGYSPTSDFLGAILNDEVRLDGNDLGEMNFRRLLAMTRDEDESNRDWAVFLLARDQYDRSDARDALLAATDDEAEDVRAEAIWGVTRGGDCETGLRLVRRTLDRGEASVPILEAAARLADASLAPSIRQLLAGTDTYYDRIVIDALTACETGVPADL